MRLRGKISNGKRPVVVYEILPPRIIDGTIESYAERISKEQVIDYGKRKGISLLESERLLHGNLGYFSSE